MNLDGALRIQVKNWTEFQHYRDRHPTWIKLHKRLLDDYEFQRLPDASRALAPMIWLLASEYNDGIISATLDELSFRLHRTNEETTKAIIPLITKGFLILEQVASNSLAEGKQEANPEKRREYKPEEKSQTLLNSKSKPQPHQQRPPIANGAAVGTYVPTTGNYCWGKCGTILPHGSESIFCTPECEAKHDAHMAERKAATKAVSA